MGEMLRINARELAESACMGGDLSRGAAITQMQDGLRTHQAIGRCRVGASLEEPIACDIVSGDLSIRLTGRIDVYYPGETPIVEEIKSTSRPLSTLDPDGYAVHWAQALAYAYAIVRRENASAAELRLTYISLIGDHMDVNTITRHMPRQKIEDQFDALLSTYLNWIGRLLDHKHLRDSSLATLKFPYKTYRGGQRDMLKSGYAALRDGQMLLVEAPTGIGKTMAAVFPALKALEKGHVNAVFYLTARGTTQAICQDALSRLTENGAHIRSVIITAKDRICPNGGCNAATCARAAGYYDRLRAALIDCMSVLTLNRPAIEAIAEKHNLCPFEFSLDASLTCDMIICDYNYAFDPRVMLKRFFQKKGKWGLLIDEAHNLPQRTRDMLTARFNIEEIAQATREIGEYWGENSQYFHAVSQLFAQLSALPMPHAIKDLPAALVDALKTFIETLEEQLYDLTQSATNLWFEAKYAREIAENWSEQYCLLAENDEVALMCLDAAPYLKKIFKRVKGGILFSATLSPSRFYFAQCGLSEDHNDACLSLFSPFPEENLLTLTLPIATRYKMRERTYADVAAAIAAMARAHVGNYIACFPSHAYLAQVLPLFKAQAPEIDALVQRPTLRAERRAAFLNKFAEHPTKTMVAFIVLGGVFAEGIDLPGSRLSGAAIVGMGLPQICFERDALRAYNQHIYESGYEYAYIYPGICKVLQAAGRVIRTHEDRGVVMLIDERYLDDPIRALFPPHWRVNNAATPENARAAMEAFWEQK